MEPSLNITSSSRLRVLLIPVGPITQDTFSKHVELVKQFSELKLSDVTPDMKKGAGGKPNFIFYFYFLLCSFEASKLFPRAVLLLKFYFSYWLLMNMALKG